MTNRIRPGEYVEEEALAMPIVNVSIAIRG